MQKWARWRKRERFSLSVCPEFFLSPQRARFCIFLSRYSLTDSPLFVCAGLLSSRMSPMFFIITFFLFVCVLLAWMTRWSVYPLCQHQLPKSQSRFQVTLKIRSPSSLPSFLRERRGSWRGIIREPASQPWLLFLKIMTSTMWRCVRPDLIRWWFYPWIRALPPAPDVIERWPEKLQKKSRFFSLFAVWQLLSSWWLITAPYGVGLARQGECVAKVTCLQS